MAAIYGSLNAIRMAWYDMRRYDAVVATRIDKGKKRPEQSRTERNRKGNIHKQPLASTDTACRI